MRPLLVIGLVLGAVCLVAGSLEESGRLDGAHWSLYKSRFNKLYSEPAEEAMRMRMFLEQKRRVDQHNAELATKLGYKLGLNHMSDWTNEERASSDALRADLDQLEANQLGQEEREVPEFVRKMLEVDVKDLPEEVDWRKVAGRVGPVWYQGNCGSGWAFSTTGVLEGQQYRFNNNSGQLILLSQQNLLDCSRSGKNHGCLGGSVEAALSDIASQHGLQSRQDYPYINFIQPFDHKCHFDAKKSIMSIKGVYHTNNGTAEDLMKLLAQFGPVSVKSTWTDDLSAYVSGVFSGDCSKDILTYNHGLLAVGYGTDSKLGDYWIIKNSLGALWGEDGYFRIARTEGKDCAISHAQTIPVF